MHEHSIGITWVKPPSTEDLEKIGYAARDAALARGESLNASALALKAAIMKKAPIFCAGNLVVTLNGTPVDQLNQVQNYSYRGSQIDAQTTAA